MGWGKIIGPNWNNMKLKYKNEIWDNLKDQIITKLK